MEINCYFSVLFFFNNVADPNKSIIPEVVISRRVLDRKKSQMLKSPKRSASWDEIQPKYHKIHDINEKSINFACL